LFRCAHVIISQKRIDELAKDVGATIDAKDWIKLYQRAVGELYSDQQTYLTECFKMFDKDGKGLISILELKFIAENVGEKFTPEELAQFIKQADPQDTGVCNYSQFVSVMITPPAKAKAKATPSKKRK